MKFERTQMHFAKDFFAAFAVVRSPYWRSAVAEVSVFNRSLFSLPLNCISHEFIYIFLSVMLWLESLVATLVLLWRCCSEKLIKNPSCLRAHVIITSRWESLWTLIIKLQKYTTYHFRGIGPLWSVENVLFWAYSLVILLWLFSGVNLSIQINTFSFSRHFLLFL